MEQITNTGELRSYLCDAIIKVGNGKMDSKKASSIIKLAGQVNESLYSEVKVAKTKLELEGVKSTFGNLQIGSNDKG